jgi:hypothetical protein
MATVGFWIAGLAVFGLLGGILMDDVDNSYFMGCAVIFTIGIIIASL